MQTIDVYKDPIMGEEAKSGGIPPEETQRSRCKPRLRSSITERLLVGSS